MQWTSLNRKVTNCSSPPPSFPCSSSTSSASVSPAGHLVPSTLHWAGGALAHTLLAPSPHTLRLTSLSPLRPPRPQMALHSNKASGAPLLAAPGETHLPDVSLL